MVMFTIIKYVLAWFLGNIIFIIMGPMQKMLRYDNPMWDNMPTWMNAWGDQIYGLWILFNVLMAATMVIAVNPTSTMTAMLIIVLTSTII